MAKNREAGDYGWVLPDKNGNPYSDRKSPARMKGNYRTQGTYYGEARSRVPAADRTPSGNPAASSRQNSRNSAREPYVRNPNVQRRPAAQHTQRPSSANARRPAPRKGAGRIMMTPRQREIYERAYFEKHGRSPYRNVSRSLRENAYLEAERERKEREASLRREALERERQRREKEERQRREAEERQYEEYLKRKSERENLKRYAEEKKRYEIIAAERKKEAEKREKAAEEKRLRRQRIKNTIAFYSKLFIAAFAVTGILVFLAVYRVMWNDAGASGNSISYFYGGKEAFSADRSIAYSAGQPRIDFSSLADYLGMYVIGDSSGMKFVIPSGYTDNENGSYIRFEIGSPVAYVNETPVTLSCPAEYIGSSVWVSSEALDFFSSGIEIPDFTPKKISVSRIPEVDSKGKAKKDADGNIIYKELSFCFKSNLKAVNPAGSELFSDPGKASSVYFKADLSAYEKYMNPDVWDEYLILPDGDNPVPADYVPGDLADVVRTRGDGRETCRMRLCAEMALEAMLLEMKEYGYGDLSVTKAYVDASDDDYYDTEDEWNGEEADEDGGFDSAYNDHRTGLSADVHNFAVEDLSFAGTNEYKWMSQNCWKFGFILRFPEGKEDITGAEFEPWHFRFVGRYAAEIMFDSARTLEEYTALTAKDKSEQTE